MIFLFLLLFNLNSAFASISFSKECESNVIELIDNSNKTIDVAVYSINNQEIINALTRAKERGVQIRILTDRLQAYGESSQVPFLHEQGFDIRVHSHDRIMHHKFAIFDNTTAIQGSFNWTYSAANKNSEDCNVLQSTKDLAVLGGRFALLWGLNSQKASECYFNNMHLEKSERIKCN